MNKFFAFALVTIAFVLAAFSYKENEAKILFVGDIFLDRYIRQVSDQRGGDYIFSCIDFFLKDSDLVVGNLEGPITANASKSLGSVAGSPENYIFTFPPSAADLLKKYNVRLVNLGNNHIGNFGAEGIFSTKKHLNKSGVKYFGGLGKDLPVQGEEQIYRTNLGGQEISFVSYNEFGGDSSAKVAARIKEEKERGRTVLVYAHWGDEYSAPPARVKEAARLFARSGASLVVGSHPHVVLPSEKIGETVVYYSLGNFIFDQYWNKEVSTGLILEVNIKGEPANWSIIEHEVSINRDGRTCLKD